ncbi:MAG TPA: hypothetical protein VI259_02625 [Gemmatimonadaceae bacterium]
MILRSSLVAVVAVVSLAGVALAQSSGSAPSPIGVWRGTSLCLVKPSACHDEVVVYRMTSTKSDSVSLDARKIVNGREEEMGVLPCRIGAGRATVTCTMPNGVWRFTVRGDSLVGELRLPDSTKFRDVRAARSR